MDDSTSRPFASLSPEPAPVRPAAEAGGGSPRAAEPSRSPRRRLRSPKVAWPPWTGPVALLAGIVLAAVGSVLVDIPALVVGVKINTAHVPGGLEIADTAVQDGAFVLAAIFFAHLGGRKVAAWQFGLRPTPLWRAVRLTALTLVGFLVFSVLWGEALNSGKEKLLEQLGVGQSTALLLLSAGLTCVLAPMCEEFLFRGYIFTALRNWRGVWPAAVITGVLFGAVHAGSAPAADLVPLAGLGFGLCLLYRYTGSLYPCIAVHSLNNSIAFGGLEDWSLLAVVALMVSALALIALLVRALMRAGVISPEPTGAGADPLRVVGAGG